MSPWYERTGGYLISVALHLLLVSLLLSFAVVEVKSVEPPPIELTVAPMAEAGSAPQEMAFELPPAAATGTEADQDTAPAEPPPEPQDEKQEEAAPETPPAEAPAEQPVEKPQETPQPDPAKLAELAEQERQKRMEELLQKEWEEFRRQAPLPHESKLKEAIQSEEIRMKGQKLLDPTVGADTGAVRQFDLRGPQRVIDEIQRRYDMRIVTRWVNEAESGVGYLNRADTNRGTYRPAQAPGRYEVLEIGPAGTTKLKLLEIEAIRTRGFDPRRDRLVKIVFGIVVTDKGPDLGVVDLVAEKMSP